VTRIIPIRTVAALGAGALLLGPAIGFAQAPAPAASAAPQAQAAPAPAAPEQPAHPAVAHHPLTPAHRAAIRREHHIAHVRTAMAELEAALGDMREGRPFAARIALDHAESAVLNEREAAMFAGNEDARERAMGNVLGLVESARFNLHRDRAWSERMVRDAIRDLRAAPAL
jgi:hypothetical protein